MTKDDKFDKPDSDEIYLAAGWLLSDAIESRNEFDIDLLTLDQWREGKLDASKAEYVRAMVASDPNLMTDLASLIEADRDLAEQKINKESQTQLSSEESLIDRLFQALKYFFNGNKLSVSLAGVAALSALVALIVPILNPHNDGLDYFYNVDVSNNEVTILWRERITTRGIGEVDHSDDSQMNVVLRLAFQAGIAKAAEIMKEKGSNLDLNPGDTLNTHMPKCELGIQNCDKALDLASKTGLWAIAAYLQCSTLNTGQKLNSDMLVHLENLNEAWAGINVENDFYDQLAKLDHSALCTQVSELISRWGIPS